MRRNPRPIRSHHFTVLAGILRFLLPGARPYVLVSVEPKQLRFAVEGRCVRPGNQVRETFCARFKKSENLDVGLQNQSIFPFLQLVNPKVTISRRTAKALTTMTLNGQTAYQTGSQQDLMSFKFIPSFDGAR